MGTPYTGSCNCGDVTARIEAEPVWVRQCWCRQCQKIGCGTATTNALFPTVNVQLEGDLAWTSYTSESGNLVEQGFCGSCGTHVVARNSARQRASVVRLGFIDNPDDMAPTSAIWLDDAPSWAMIDPSLDQWPRQPPVEAPRPAASE